MGHELHGNGLKSNCYYELGQVRVLAVTLFHPLNVFYINTVEYVDLQICGYRFKLGHTFQSVGTD